MIVLNDIITSRSNPRVKWAASLTTKKGRDDARSFIAEGEKLSFEAMEGGLPVSHVFICEDKRDRLLPKVARLLAGEEYRDTEVVILSESAFLKISTEKAPQGIITVIKYLDFFREMDIIYKEEFFSRAYERVILLSSVRDPGNLGAVIRSAVAFGVDHVILTADSADLYNPKTVRSAMGSLFRVKATVVSDFTSVIRALQDSGRRVFAAELSECAVSVSEARLRSTDAVIIGNEGHGIPTDISSVCDGSVYIPISHKTESLNASVAAAVFMWEMGKTV
ncbi:MAG: RNA methyltransferase [Clostridia bacterium]|nr:RNA methyltransferase [Clostridia bacterium]